MLIKISIRVNQFALSGVVIELSRNVEVFHGVIPSFHYSNIPFSFYALVVSLFLKYGVNLK